MRPLITLCLCVLVVGCDEAPTSPLPDAPEAPQLSVIGADPLVGAIVLNRGEASDPFTGTCTFAGRVTHDVQAVRTPNGGGLLRCQWRPWPTSTEFDRAFRASGFGCWLNHFGFSTTQESSFVIARNGQVATLSCRFRAMQGPAGTS